MKRFIPISLIALFVAVLSFGFRGGGFRGNRTFAGEYTFTDSVTFNGRVAFKGVVFHYDASMWIKDDTLFLTDGGEDTSYIVQDGSYLYLNGDNEICLAKDTYTASIYPASPDTTRYLGSAAMRWKEVWGKRLMWSSPDAADSGKIYDSGDSTFLYSDNPMSVLKDIRFTENVYADTFSGMPSALPGNWNAGDYDITGLEKLEADSLFGIIDTTGGDFTAYVANHAGSAAIGESLAALRQTANEITATWQWDGGNLIAADGQKLIWTDGTEADSGSIYDAGDTTHFTSDNPIRLGGAGTTVIDSAKLGGGATLKKWVQVGSQLAFIENDADTFYAPKDSVDDEGAGAATGEQCWDIVWIHSQQWEYVALAAYGVTYLSWAPWGAQKDSLTVDSIRAVLKLPDTDDYIDSVCMFRGVIRDSLDSTTVVWGNGTNVGNTQTGMYAYTYASINKTIAFDWRPCFKWLHGGDTDIRIYGWKIYGHVK